MEKMLITKQEELTQVVDALLAKLATHTAKGAVVIALHGDLGAGKTTFMQYFAARLGVREDIVSPTFVIMKQYEREDTTLLPACARLLHLDAYRIEAIDEMRVLGFEALLQQKDTIICIEWAEKIKELLPNNTIDVTFIIDGEERVVTIT